MLRFFGVSLQNCKFFRLFVGFALRPWHSCVPLRLTQSRKINFLSDSGLRKRRSEPKEERTFGPNKRCSGNSGTLNSRDRHRWRSNRLLPDLRKFSLRHFSSRFLAVLPVKKGGGGN